MPSPSHDGSLLRHITGKEVPCLWKEHVQKRDAQYLELIVEHNLEDLLKTVCLLLLLKWERDVSVTEYYFDIETSDLDPRDNEVIAVAYQAAAYGRPRGTLSILKSWEAGGEKRLLEDVLKLGLFETGGRRAFDFIPVGVNLNFDFTFLMTRMNRLGVHRWSESDVLRFFRDKPVKDIKTALVLMNDGKFSGSGLETFTRKKQTSGAAVVEISKRQDYKALGEYIHQDAAGFFDLYEKLVNVLKDFGKQVRSGDRGSY